MCASHGGEPRHAALAAQLLRSGGFAVADLECGAHLPMHDAVRARADPRGQSRRRALHNNCSGKHAGMLLACRLLGLPHAGYTDPASPPAAADPLAPRRLRRTCRSLQITIAVDGCNLPVFRLPLSALALAYARLTRRRGCRARTAPGRGGARPHRARDASGSRRWSPGPAASRPTSSRPAAAAGSARRAPRASTPSACGRSRRGAAHGHRLQDRGRLRARPRRGDARPARRSWTRLPEDARRALAVYAEPPVHNARGADVGRIEADVPLTRRRLAARATRQALRAMRSQVGAMAYRKPLGDSWSALEAGRRSRARSPAPVSPRLEIAEIADRAVKARRPRPALRERRRAPRCRSRSTRSHRASRMQRALDIASWEEWDERLDFFLDPKPPEGTPRQAQGDSEGRRARGRLSEDGPITVACQEVVATGDAVDLSAAARPDVLAAGRRAVHHDAAGHHEGPGEREDERRHVPDAGLRPARRPACTGRSTRTARDRRAATSARAAAWRSPSRSAAIRRPSSPRSRRCRRASRSFSSRASSAARRVPLVRAKTVDLLVPAEAEIVLEGYVDPKERRREGPFGDHTGFYSLEDDFPVFHVTAVTRRERPVYLTTIVGRPPMEDGFMGEAVERLFLPLVKKTIPEIVRHVPSRRRHLPQPDDRRDRQALSRATPARRCTRSGARAR